MILVEKPNIEDLSTFDANKIEYCPIPKEDEWTIGFVKELTDVKFGEATLLNFERDEIVDLLNLVCTS